MAQTNVHHPDALGRSGGRPGKAFAGTWHDHFAGAILDPRIDGGRVCKRPKSERALRVKERLQTALGVVPEHKHK